MLLAWLAVSLASVFSIVRGPLRANSGFNDLAAPYVSTRLWLRHQNPYDAVAFIPAWYAAGGPQINLKAESSSRRPVYPPPCLIILTPLAALSWKTAVWTLTVVGFSAYVMTVHLFCRLIPGTWRDPMKPLFLAFALALAPAQSAIHVSNIACLSASLLLIGLYRLLTRTHDPEVVAALCIALSACIKPTLGLLILPYLLIVRAWRTLAITLAACVLLTGLSLVRLAPLGTQWITSLNENIDVVFQNGGAADVTEQNLARVDRIDLQVPLYSLTHSPMAATLLALSVTVILLGLWLRPSLFLSDSLDGRLLIASTLLLLGLLPFSQRYYSAILLLPIILWSFRNLSSATARLILAFCTVFLVNTEALLQRGQSYFLFSQHSPGLANAVLGPHLCWLLLGIACTALFALRNQAGRKRYPGLPIFSDS